MDKYNKIKPVMVPKKEKNLFITDRKRSRETELMIKTIKKK